MYKFDPMDFETRTYSNEHKFLTGYKFDPMDFETICS